MADITAKMVMALRENTGQAMMDCKKALIESNGNMEDAVDILRKKGMAVIDKRAGKATSEGRVVGKIANDGKTGSLFALCSETDFTAKNEEFVAATDQILESLAGSNGELTGAAALGDLQISSGEKVSDIINNLVSKTGEKIELGDFAHFYLVGGGLLHCYIHFNNKVGAMVQLETDGDPSADELKTLGADLTMHITACRPSALSRDELDQALVEKERALAVEQVKGKPENIIDKIVDGKMNKWYAEIVLLEQAFAKDDSMQIKDVIEETGKKMGSPITLKRFARIQVG